MKLVFARHGESEANILKVFSNRGSKHGLTEKGRAQAISLAGKLARFSLARMYSSPLLRAVQTAEILGRELNVPYEVVDALREYDCGVLEGRSDAAGWAEYQRVWEDWVYYQRWQSRIEGGESFIEIRNRFVPFIERLLEEYGDSSGGTVLIGHGGLYRCMLPQVLENIDIGFAVKHPLCNTGFVEAEVDDGKLVCVGWSGMRLLKVAGA